MFFEIKKNKDKLDKLLKVCFKLKFRVFNKLKYILNFQQKLSKYRKLHIIFNFHIFSNIKMSIFIIVFLSNKSAYCFYILFVL